MNCEGCGALCCGRQTHEDLFSLFLLPEDKLVMRSKVPNIKIQDMGPVGYFETKGRCPCLDGDKCGIYLQRPMMCRVFPLMLYLDAPSREVAFDLSLCPHHDPGESTPLGEVAKVFASFKVTPSEFFDQLILYFIKEVRVEDILDQMSLRDRNRLAHKQAALRAIESHNRKLLTRPVIPPHWYIYFHDKAKEAYSFYKTHFGNKPFRSQEFIRIMITQIGLMLTKDAESGVVL